MKRALLGLCVSSLLLPSVAALEVVILIEGEDWLRYEPDNCQGTQEVSVLENPQAHGGASAVFPTEGCQAQWGNGIINSVPSSPLPSDFWIMAKVNWALCATVFAGHHHHTDGQGTYLHSFGSRTLCSQSWDTIDWLDVDLACGAEEACHFIVYDDMEDGALGEKLEIDYLEYEQTN